MAALLAGPMAVPALAQNIGVAAAVKNDVFGVVGGAERPLAAGNDVVRDQLIRTGTAASAQVLFLDETSLSVGPNSEVKLDRFVYNPAARTADIAVSASKGVLRFISGSSDPRGYSVKTPSATIGFRGTVADIIAGIPTIIILVEGKLEITLPNGQVVTLTVPGTAIAVHGDGNHTDPFRWDGSYTGVVAGTAYPLFASGFIGNPEEREFSDGKFNMMDEANSLVPLDEPNECTWKCGGEGGYYGDGWHHYGKYGGGWHHYGKYGGGKGGGQIGPN